MLMYRDAYKVQVYGITRYVSYFSVLADRKFVQAMQK